MCIRDSPGIEALAYDLVADGPSVLRERLSRKYPTGGLAVIDCAVDNWRDLHSRCGTLVAFVIPRDLDREAE